MIINQNINNSSGLTSDEADFQTQINDLSNKVDDNTTAITTLQNKDIADQTSITTGALTQTTETVATQNITTANITTANITNENVVGTDASFTNLTAGNIILGAGKSKMTSYQLYIPHIKRGFTLFTIKDEANVVCYIKEGDNIIQSFTMNGKVLSIYSLAQPFIKMGYDSDKGLAYIQINNQQLDSSAVLTVLNMESLDTDVVSVIQNDVVPDAQDSIYVNGLTSQVMICSNTYCAATFTSKSGAEKTGSINCDSVIQGSGGFGTLTQSGDIGGNLLPFIGQILMTDGTSPQSIYSNTTWSLIKQE